MWGWLICVPWLCVILLDPYTLGNHAQLGGGNVAKILMSMLAYGLVELCSDMAGCGTSSYQMSILVHIASTFTFTDES